MDQDLDLVDLDLGALDLTLLNDIPHALSPQYLQLRADLIKGDPDGVAQKVQPVEEANYKYTEMKQVRCTTREETGETNYLR